jgi:hypothetical protein
LSAEPLVTCIMPTYDRPRFVIEAVRGFLAQDYPRRELFIVDDGENPVGDLLPSDARIRYLYVPGRKPIGTKRNIACENALGELIAHVDDDDWCPSTRLSSQVQAMQGPGVEICGTSRLHFLDPIRDRAWLYAYPRGGWVAGQCLMYRRSFWQEHRFRPIQVGEDWTFVRSTSRPGALLDLRDPSLCVAMLHGKNASPKSPDAYWQAVDCAPVAERLGARIQAYRAAAAGECPEPPSWPV